MSDLIAAAGGRWARMECRCAIVCPACHGACAVRSGPRSRQCRRRHRHHRAGRTVSALGDRWEGGKLTGYWVELPRLAAARAEVPILNIDPVPYVRALREVAAGDGLCHPFVARTPAREPHYRWIAPTRRIVISVFVIAGTTDAPKSIDDLRHRELAVQRDTFGDATLNALGIPATRVTDTNQLGSPAGARPRVRLCRGICVGSGCREGSRDRG